MVCFQKASLFYLPLVSLQISCLCEILAKNSVRHNTKYSLKHLTTVKIYFILKVGLHAKYYENARQLLEEISPAHSQYFTKCLTEKLTQLHAWRKAQVSVY